MQINIIENNIKINNENKIDIADNGINIDLSNSKVSSASTLLVKKAMLFSKWNRKEINKKPEFDII